MDEVTRFNDWINTRKALETLEQLLICRACQQTVNDPYTLGNCNHIFCRDCVQPFQGYCPDCKVPSIVKDVKPNRQIKITLLHCKQMRIILGLNQSANQVNNDNQGIDENIIENKEKLTEENGTDYKDENQENKIMASNTKATDRMLDKSTDSMSANKSGKRVLKKKLAKVYPDDHNQTKLNNFDQPIIAKQYSCNKLAKITEAGNSNHGNIKTDGNVTVNIEELATVHKVMKSTLEMGHILLETANSSTPQSVKRPSRLRKSGNFEIDPTSNKTISPKMTTPKSRLNQYLKRNALGETALHTSVIKGQAHDVQLLLQQGSNPNIKDNAGWSPLHEACNHGHLEIASILLDNGAIVNASAMDNVTPLHDAVANDHVDVATLLITRGADLHLRNLSGLTPRDLATSKEMRRILETTFPSVVNNTHIATSSSQDEVTILTSGLSGVQEEKLQKFAALLDARVVKDFADDVTHLVTACSDNGVCARTIKFLNGIITGKWIVQFEWIEACLLTESREAEEKFEVNSCTTNLNCDGPRRGRLNRQMQHPGLFSGCQFYFRGNFLFPNPPKKHLESLVQRGQGVVLTREPKANMEDGKTIPFHTLPNSSISNCTYFVVYANDNAPRLKHNSDAIRYLPVSWLLDCVASFQIIDPE